MPRASKFDEDQILTAAGRIIATHGPSGATIGAIARAVGAPTGSIYHRFDSRDVVLAKVWLRAAATFQAAFFERLRGSPPRKAGLDAALYMAERVRLHPQEARLLLHHRREDFVDRGWPAGLRRQAAELGQRPAGRSGAGPLQSASLRPRGRANGSDRGLRGGGGSLRGSAAARLRP